MTQDPHAPAIDDSDIETAWAHARAKIEAATLELDPFAMIRVEDVFPAEFYRALLERMPDNEAYDFSIAEEYTVVGNEKQRGAVRFEEAASIARLKPAHRQFWEQLTTPAMAVHLVNTLVGKFRPHLDVPAQVVQSGKPVNIYGKWLLSRDRPGYELAPHLDAGQKLIAGLFYLPDETQQSPYGTTLMAPKPGRSDIQPGQDRYAREDFDVAVQVPFRANSFLAFVRNDKSFHGVDRVGPEITQRDILMFNVNVA